MALSDIRLSLYEYFIAAYENKSMTRAAEQLGVQQPNVTRNVKEIERILGVALFRSNSRGIVPTTHADQLYQRVAPAFKEILIGENNVKSFNESSSGVVRIAVATNFAAHILAKEIALYKKRYPKVQFIITNKSFDEAIRMLENRSTDLVFSTLPYDKKIKFDKFTLRQLSATYFTSPAFAQQNGLTELVSKEKFETLPFVSIRLMENERQELPIVIVDTQETVYQLVKNGLGVGRCLEQFLDCNHSNDNMFRFRVKDIELPKFTLECIYNKNYLTNAAKAFLE